MKKALLFLSVFAAMSVLVSCGASKKSSNVIVSQKPAVSIEGKKVTEVEMQMSGIEMGESLNEDGTGTIKRPYKWYAGIGEADDQQVAIELAQREAYASISRVFSNIVRDGAERGNVATNKKVQQALTSHWEQLSESIQKSCEPFGKAVLQYNRSTKMYKVIAKVGIRGDIFNQLLDSAGDFTPKDLSGEDLQQFLETNRSIMEAARAR